MTKQSVWRRVKLRDVADIERHTLQPKQIPGGTPFVGLEHIASSGAFLPVPRISNGDVSSSKFVFTAHHILYGKLRPYLSKIARPSFDGVCSTDILPILPRADIDRDYLFFFLRQPNLVKLATEQSIGANLPRLSPTSLSLFDVILPPLPVQKQIAAILEKADAAREKRRKANKLTEQFFQSAFLEMFGDPVTNPKGWEQKRVQELTTSHDNKRIPIEASIRKGRPGKYPYYGASGVIDHVDDYLFDFKAILVGEDGANLEARSTPVAFSAEGKYWVNNHAHVITPKDGTTHDYLLFFFNTIDLSPYLSGTAQPKLTAANLGRIPVAVPPLSAQLRFASLAEKVNRLQMKQRDTNVSLEVLFQSLMQMAFAGELCQ